jgi:hypothetical protein
MRLDKRRLLGPLFGPLSRAKHSRASRYLLATVALPSQLFRAHWNKPYFAVDISGGKGLGALICEAVLMCHHAERNRLTPLIFSSNPLYAHRPGEDFLPHYLAVPALPPGVHLRPMKYRTLQSFYHLDFAHHLPLSEAARLFRAYLAPGPRILVPAQAILDRTPRRAFDLSVHYRATDKLLEAPQVPYDAVKQSMHRHAAAGGMLDHVFLATDDARFDAYIREAFPATVFYGYNLGGDVDASRGRHFSDMQPEDKVIESLVNMVLLAAAPTCIRCASYMSAVSKFINPELKTITLNRDHWGSRAYPEFEILAEEEARSQTRST